MLLDVISVNPRPDFQLDLEFENGERRRFDVRPLLIMKPWVRIASLRLFELAHVEYGTVVWPDEVEDSKALIYEIYKYLEDMKNELTNYEKLLAEQWVQAYKKVPDESVEKIKQEVNMSFSATTITEHYVNMGRNEGKIEALEELYRFSFLSKEQMEKMIEPLKEQLQNLQSSEKSALEGLIQIPCSSSSANEPSLTP